MIKWQRNNIFDLPFLVIGNWNFSTYEKFSHCDYVSADTETKLYYKGDLLTEQKAYEYYKNFGAKWCRQNIVVKAYAFMLSDGENFALFQCIEDFIKCCATMLVKKVFWYNAKFDFAIFDYYFAINHWERSQEVVENFNKQKHKIHSNVFQSMDGDFGQRYQLRIWKSYKNRNYNIKVHNFKMIDICNIFGGGLRRNLEDWGIVDKEGKEVRKLTMDYVNASIENDIDYMVADTKGLHLLAEKINEKIKEISGYSLFDGDYITAGGLAKKSLLNFMFGDKKVRPNMKTFKALFPMTVEEDKNYRELKLYQGGKCFVSPYYINKIVKNIRKYDVNSMYPHKMKSMLYPVGNPKVVKQISNNERKIYVLKIKNIIGNLKENMVPVWYDVLTSDYVFQIFEEDLQYFWYEELQMLEKYYNLTYEIEEILEFDGYYCKGAQKYVDTFYKIKSSSKGAIKQGAKLFLNSAYGKLAERVEKVSCQYELSEEGYMHLVKGETTIDEKSLMSILVGSRITALARVQLMDYILKICHGNPKKYFLYCDTDSVHALCDYEETDDKELGKMKNEGIYEYGKYLAPKTYVLYNNIEKQDKKYEVHTKGVNVYVVEKELEKCENFNQASEIFKAGIDYKCLASLNCIGGKALIYIDKKLLDKKREKEPLDNDERID